MSKLRDEAEDILKKTMQDFNLQIADLRQELYEKSAMCDQVIETHQAELKAKQEEMEEEMAACNRMYQSKIAQVEQDYQEQLGKIQKTRQIEAEDNSWNWERATSIDEEAVQDLQRTPTREQREQQLRQINRSVRLLSFYFGGSKLFRFLAKIEHIPRRLLHFVNRQVLNMCQHWTFKDKSSITRIL